MKYCVQITVLWMSLFSGFAIHSFTVECMAAAAVPASMPISVHEFASAVKAEDQPVAGYTPPEDESSPQGSHTSGGIRG